MRQKKQGDKSVDTKQKTGRSAGVSTVNGCWTGWVCLGFSSWQRVGLGWREGTKSLLASFSGPPECLLLMSSFRARAATCLRLFSFHTSNHVQSNSLITVKFIYMYRIMDSIDQIPGCQCSWFNSAWVRIYRYLGSSHAASVSQNKPPIIPANIHASMF